MANFIRKRIEQSIFVKKAILKDGESIALMESIVSSIVEALNNDHKVLFAGNGVSLADAFHLWGEFVNRLRFDRRSLPALALGPKNLILTAIAMIFLSSRIF